MALASALMLSSRAVHVSPYAIPAESYRTQIPNVDIPYQYSNIERQMLVMGLADLGKTDARLIIDPVYATKDNLTDSILYPYLKRSFLQPQIANKLSKAQDHLSEINPELRLVVLDAARPQSVQFALWKWAVDNNRQKYVAAPSLGSVHNFGCAVDVTISNTDTLLDMGTEYDHFGPEAEPRYHAELLAKGVLTEDQIANRLLLKNVMRKAGFRAIQSEWWHFNGVSKEFAREHFTLIP